MPCWPFVYMKKQMDTMCLEEEYRELFCLASINAACMEGSQKLLNYQKDRVS